MTSFVNSKVFFFATILIHIIIRHTKCLSMYITQEILGRKFIVLTFLANKNLPDKRRDVSCIATLVVGIPYLYLWARFTIQHIKCSGKPIKTHESSLHTPKRMKRFDISSSHMIYWEKNYFETYHIPHSWGWRTSCFNGTQSG